MPQASHIADWHYDSACTFLGTSSGLQKSGIPKHAEDFWAIEHLSLSLSQKDVAHKIMTVNSASLAV